MPDTISENFLHEVSDKLKRNKRVKRRLDDYGKISIERKLPYLLIYRHPTEIKDSGTIRLVLAESSYIFTSKFISDMGNFKKLLKTVIKAMTAEFGAYLVIEIWSCRDESKDFKVFAPHEKAKSTVNSLRKGFTSMQKLYPETDVKVIYDDTPHPDDMAPVLTKEEIKKLGCLYLGLQVPDIFKDPSSGQIYPVFFRKMRERFSEVLQKGIFDFVRVQTNFQVENYYMLGRSTIDATVWHIDKELAEIERSFQYLLLMAPINSEKAWKQFRKRSFEGTPKFRYRLLPVDPDLLKRKLYNLNIHKIDDPTLSYIFRDKREELDTQLTLLSERNTRNFLYSAIRLYKGVDDSLLKVALEILQDIPAERNFEAEPVPKRAVHIDANGFKEKATEEFEYYKKSYSGFSSRIEVRNDVPGLMVSHGDLYIPTKMKIAPSRVDALIHHEVGTHVLTYCNGSAQPLQQLRYGLADYDELQEGIAVLSEYLVGGLSRDRLRLLAARVVVSNAVIQGASFTETYRLLVKKYSFKKKAAFSVVTRIYQCGGFIKDVIYLRGLIRLMEHLKKGGEFEHLFIGKIAEKHIPAIKELEARKVLKPAPLVPRFLKFNIAQKRLEKVRKGIPLNELINISEEAT